MELSAPSMPPPHRSNNAQVLDWFASQVNFNPGNTLLNDVSSIRRAPFF